MRARNLRGHARVSQLAPIIWRTDHMSRTLARARLGLVAAGAFFGGLIVAAGVNLTPFGYAQQQGTAPKPSAQEVKPLADASQAFVSIADHVTPAVVSDRKSTRLNSSHS